MVLCLLVACTSGGTPADPTPPPAADPLLDLARRDGSVMVVVGLAVAKGSAGSWDSAAIGKAQRRLLSELGPGARVVERFGRKLPQIALRVTPGALQELRRSPLVVEISLNDTDAPTE